MTCIIGLETNDSVVVGSDSFLGNTSVKYQLDRPKWFFREPDLLVAYAGDIIAAQLMELIPKFAKQRRTEDDQAYLQREVVGAIRAVHKLQWEKDRNADFELLIAYRGKLYTLMSNYGLYRNMHKYAAIGAGEDIAIGVMAGLELSKLKPKEKVLKALALTKRHSPLVSEPFFTIEVAKG